MYGYARKFAQIGISDALVEALRDGLHSPGVISVCVALKAVAVNVSLLLFLSMPLLLKVAQYFLTIELVRPLNFMVNIILLPILQLFSLR